MTQTYLLDIELREPIALTDGSSDSAGGHTTLDYIPGTSLLGAFVTAFGIAPSDPRFARMFLSSSTRFLNAYPSVPSAEGESRTLPRPLTFKSGKIDRARLHDSIRATGAPVDDTELHAYFAREGSPDSMKSSRAAFVANESPDAEHRAPRVEQVHVGIDRTERTAKDGVLFTYEAIRAGTRFVGAIQTEDDAVAQLLTQTKEISLRLGRSRSAGYGQATAKVAEAPRGWREYTSAPSSVGSHAVVTLLSDYLPHLELGPALALRAELAALAGVEASRVEIRSAGTRQVRGFRGVWGLPRPARTALVKGSVLVIAESIDVQSLSQALSRGIGSRVNEGFGRFAVDWTIHGRSTSGGQALSAPTVQFKLPRPKVPVSNATTAALRARRTERKRREFVDAALRLDRVKKVAQAMMSLPPAQLGNLRAAVSGTMTPAEIGDWFKALSEKTAGDRWKRIDVPAIASDKPYRAGHAFVWESLFGGDCSEQDSLSGTIDTSRWRKAIDVLGKEVARPDLLEAARAQPETALRHFIAGLVSNASRLRNTRDTQEAAR